MYCHHCGQEVMTGTKICPYCGADLNTHKERVRTISENDAPSRGFAALSFFFPVIGLILYVIWRREYPLKAKSCIEGSIAGIIIHVFFNICLYSGIIGIALSR